MAVISLNSPKPSKFSSSLNEIDLAFNEVMLNQMRIADPRDKTGKPDTVGGGDNWLWSRDRVFQVDEFTTEEVFNTWVIRNSKKAVDVSYPLLGFVQKDIETVNWGKGNRISQWKIDLHVEPVEWKVGDVVVIVSPNQLKGVRGTIASINMITGTCTLKVGGTLCVDSSKTAIAFPFDSLRAVGISTQKQFKAKAITLKYDTVVLVDNRDEAQYLRDKFILRCADGQIWHEYESPVIEGAENQIYTVFGIPNLDRYPIGAGKLKGEGFIYGVTFSTDVWAALTDEPLPSSIIESIRMSVKYDTDGPTRRFVIS